MSRYLDLEVKHFEKKQFQKDESVRMEITFSKEQYEVLLRAQELLSHVDPGLSVVELVTKLATEFVQRKDPARDRRMKTTNGVHGEGSEQKADLKSSGLGSLTPESGVEKRGGEEKPGLFSRKALSAQQRRFVFRTYKNQCQWKNPETGKICGSRHQLEVDHRKPLWAGGGNESSNLWLLCRSHNQLKYQREAGIRRISKT